MDSEDKKILERYVQIADLLGQMFPNILEIAVHSFEDLDKAIIHIVNGHISGRKAGEPVSELNMSRLIEQERFPDVLLNYTSCNSRGQQLKSSSLIIRNDDGERIGAFCLHLDISQFKQFQGFIEHLICSQISPMGVNDFGASQPYRDEIKKEIDHWLLQNGLYASQLTYQDKRNLVEHLYHRGSFQKKGAVFCVASVLQLTRQCIYNYIQLTRENTKGYPYAPGK